MSENYYYSSLSGQEIEDTLVGAVRFNAMQGLTTSQKAQARQNIGAGEESTQIKIKGFYDTLEDLQQQIPVGNEGDVYAVGTESPYDIYIWDAVNNVWVNNGPISFSDAIIDDNDISTTSVWSSAKTTNEIAEVSSDVDAVEGSLATYVRPNLLDNAYFVGGGSQGGYSKFPINQRGQTSYNSGGYGIDRWKIDGYVTLTLNSDYITITKSDSAAYRGISQRIEVSGLTGKTVTLSLLCMGGSTGDFRLTVADSNNAIVKDAYPNIGVANTEVLRSVSFTATDDVLWVCLRPNAISSLMVKAVKLELGSTQTLAHQENETWALNEIPNYAEELAKCRRYLQIIYSVDGTNGPLVGGYGFSSTNVRISVPLVCPLRAVPTVSFLVGSISTVSLISDSGVLSSTAVGVAYNAEGTTVMLMFTVSGATTSKTYWLNGNGIKIMLSAEP